MSSWRVGIFGAGAIGAYLGVRFSAAGIPVTMVGRQELVDARLQLKAYDLAGNEYRLSKSAVVSTDPAALADCDVVLVTVKSGDTAAAADALAPVLRNNTAIVSLQNSIRNISVLRSRFNTIVLPGMVTFNVLRESTATFRKTTSGPILIGGGNMKIQPLIDLSVKAGEPMELSHEIEAVQVAKLLLNLNNGLCALTGLSIAESLRNRDVRRSFAVCLREGVEVVRKAGLPVGRIGPLSPSFVAKVLPLPDWIFFRLAKSMMEISPAARSSTLQDLERGRRTEIDYLNGEIVRLASDVGIPAPANAFVTDGVHRLEREGNRRFHVRPEELWAQMQKLSKG